MVRLGASAFRAPGPRFGLGPPPPPKSNKGLGVRGLGVRGLFRGLGFSPKGPKDPIIRCSVLG